MAILFNFTQVRVVNFHDPGYFNKAMNSTVLDYQVLYCTVLDYQVLYCTVQVRKSVTIQNLSSTYILINVH